MSDDEAETEVRVPSAGQILDPDHPDYYRVAGDYDDDGEDVWEEVSDEADALADDEFVWPEYIGETKRRSPIVATLLTLLSPGLGYAYVGRFVTGLMVNTFFPTALFAFVVSWALYKFFPVVPAAVFGAAWLALVGLVLYDVLGLVARAQPYVVRPINHVAVYVSLFLFTFALPIYAVVHWSTDMIWQRTWSSNDEMYPTIVDGDLILVDRSAYLGGAPDRGDLVLVEEPSDGIYFARVVGIANDRVHMEGTQPWVNGRELFQRARGPLDMLDGHPPLASSGGEMLWSHIEAPYGVQPEEDDESEPARWYLITKPVRPRIEPLQPVQVADDELFVINDNRAISFERPGEHIGGRLVQREWVVGRPLFVLDDTEDERTGLRLR